MILLLTLLPLAIDVQTLNVGSFVGRGDMILSTNRLWMQRTDNTIYASAWWPGGKRWELSLANQNAAIATESQSFINLYLRNSVNPLDHDTGVQLGNMGDDIPPFLSSFANYISGNHGWLLPKITWPNHGGTVGDHIIDSGNVNYALFSVLDSSNIVIVPNSATQLLPFFDPAKNLTNVTAAKTALSGQWTEVGYQVYPCWLTQTQWLNADNVAIGTNSIVPATNFVFGCDQIIWDPRPAYATALGNPSFTYTQLPALCRRVRECSLNGVCQLTTTDTITSQSATNWSISYAGAMQATSYSASLTWMWFPNSKAVGSVNLSNPVVSSAVSVLTTWTNNTACCVDTNVGLNVFWTYDLASVGATTNFTAGHVMAYDPDYGDSSTAKRATNGVAWFVSTATKSYPESAVGKTFTNGDSITLKAYRKWFPPSGTFYTNQIITRYDGSLMSVSNAFRTAL